MDGSGVSQSAPIGGTVNCNFGIYEWKMFKIEHQEDGSVDIASVAFPEVYLRIDGGDCTEVACNGCGAVNCHWGVGPEEKLMISYISIG